tara:strand:- start:113 stop:1342 length:1230 start_codon:yes stop_codon:yes gene_type:complete
MKLFNIVINNKLLKNIGKLLIILFIILFCLYILYFSSLKTVEGFSQTLDCSKCEIKPSSGNCKDVYKISQTINGDDTSFSLNYNYTFCPPEPKCPLLDNIVSQEQRMQMSNENLNNNQALNNIICCSNSSFYDNNLINYYNVQTILDNSIACLNIYKNINDISKSDTAKFDKIINSDAYLELRSVCNPNINTDVCGMLFRRQQSDSTSGIDINDMNKTMEIYDYKYNLLNTQDLTPYIDQINPDKYLLNKDEFFDCFGMKKNNNDMSFNAQQLKDFSENNYFDIADDANYTTLQDNNQRLYPNENDLKMELKNLEQIPEGGNVPVSVINNYLRTINNFYEKQMYNMMGPKIHNFNEELVFDNNTLKTKESTFFSYDNCYNNTYNCEASVTDNNKFEYCGPAPYNETPTF